MAIDYKTIEPGIHVNELIQLAKDVKANPADLDHVTKGSFLVCCITSDYDSIPDNEPFGSSSPKPKTIEECCDALVKECDAAKTQGAKYGASGLLLKLAMRLVRFLVDRWIDGEPQQNPAASANSRTESKE